MLLAIFLANSKMNCMLFCKITLTPSAEMNSVHWRKKGLRKKLRTRLLNKRKSCVAKLSGKSSVVYKYDSHKNDIEFYMHNDHCV